MDKYCPDCESCNVPYVSCHALRYKNSNHRECDIYKANHFLETAAIMLEEMDTNGDAEHSNIRPELIEERELGLDLHDMPDDVKIKCYETFAMFRMWAGGVAAEAIESGCRKDKYIEALNGIEDSCTTHLKSLEDDGIRIEVEEQTQPKNEYAMHK